MKNNKYDTVRTFGKPRNRGKIENPQNLHHIIMTV